MVLYESKKHAHRAERIANKQLYGINGISFEEMLENFTTLVEDADDSAGTATTANLPMNRDVLKAVLN